MRDPQFPSGFFVRDTIVSRESIHLQVIDPSGQGVSSGGVFRFCGGRLLLVTATFLHPDLSAFDTLCPTVKNRSAETVLMGVKLFHPEGFSLSGGREILAPGELQRPNFPIECFGAYGTVQDWRNISRIEFSFAREKDYAGNEAIDVEFLGLEGESRQIRSGPRLAPQGLSQELVPAALGKPVSEIVSSIYSAENPAISIPPPHLYPKESADEILTGKIMGQIVGAPINWRANPLGSLEWTHFLHRHHFLRAFVIALAEKGDPRYAEALESIMCGWIAENPVPVDSNGGAGPAWETLSVGWRLREWLWVAGVTRGFESFREAARLRILCSIWEHARSLMDHEGHPNNWIIVESAALALAGLCFPGFRESGLWLGVGLERLDREFRRQFFSDGVHFEISPLYHSICLHALLEVKEVGEVAGQKLPELFGAPLERCTDYLQALCRPNFTWPSLNDSGSADMDYTMLMRKVGEIFQRPDLLWIGSRGSEGEPPEAGLKVFPDTGLAVMRSGFQPDANLLVFRAGLPGAAHVHEDILSLDLTALGVPRLVDPGITTYGPDPLTEHYRRAEAHNTVLIDGRGPSRSTMPFSDRIRPAGEEFSYQVGDGFCSATGSCRWSSGTDGDTCEVTRTVVFVDSRYWVVRDFVFGEGEHEIRVCWQFAPGLCKPGTESLVVQCFDPGGSGFELIPCFGDARPAFRWRTGSLNPVAGWVSMQGRDVPALSCDYTLKERLPVTQLWLLWPFAGISNVQRLERITTREGGTVLEIHFENRSCHAVAFRSEKRVSVDILR
ncbi:MAG: alginate lyase family protein [Desulfomonile tiedjei]|uniref:Alginate lyase family protein n=1 Tax=Desulfomonile tiedjei TaxID=2358 RepID=A0A9D6Z1X8_9BACT|nr:alginate lyase family protein [Desulfomonile tiedjei]